LIGMLRAGGSTRRIPRWMGPVLWLVLGSLFYIALPWDRSRIGTRRGWTADSPGVANMGGLILAVAGVAVLVWALILHYRSAPGGWPLRMRPFYLLTQGPYRNTRNPMYLGGLAIWFGWATFYGSAAVFVGFVLLAVFFNAVVTPWEERVCEEEFGDIYRRYRSEVPRWFRLSR
jgi:protein-S-isoprenylcysteine O-methyltransferase Ste14